MEEKAHIIFTHLGKEYAGYFNPVFGSGGNVWYLMVDNYYLGRLRLNDQGWFFDGKQFTELAEYFGEYLTAWYQ